jgi:ornithine carbamoyltransferase
MYALRPAKLVQHQLRSRSYSLSSYIPSSSTQTSPFAPRHLLSIADLTPAELTTLVRNADAHKQSIKSTGEVPLSLRQSLAGRTVAMTFSKRSTRTRVSTEGAIAALGAAPMFLGKDDIQLGVRLPSLFTRRCLTMARSTSPSTTPPSSSPP